MRRLVTAVVLDVLMVSAWLFASIAALIGVAALLYHLFM